MKIPTFILSIFVGALVTMQGFMLSELYAIKTASMNFASDKSVAEVKTDVAVLSARFDALLVQKTSFISAQKTPKR